MLGKDFIDSLIFNLFLCFLRKQDESTNLFYGENMNAPQIVNYTIHYIFQIHTYVLMIKISTFLNYIK